MIQFNKTDVCQLIRAIQKLKESTGSEYMWDEYEKLEQKVKSYGEEVETSDSLTCVSD
jgi:hypothetical protein